MYVCECVCVWLIFTQNQLHTYKSNQHPWVRGPSDVLLQKGQNRSANCILTLNLLTSWDIGQNRGVRRRTCRRDCGWMYQGRGRGPSEDMSRQGSERLEEKIRKKEIHFPHGCTSLSGLKHVREMWTLEWRRRSPPSSLSCTANNCFSSSRPLVS